MPKPTPGNRPRPAEVLQYKHKMHKMQEMQHKMQEMQQC